MKVRILFPAIAVVIIIILLALFLFSPKSVAQTNSIKVAAIVPLTGNASDQGNWVREALLVAKENINKDKNIEIELFFEDSKGGNPSEAITAFNKLVSENNLDALITWGSGVGVALIPLANENQLVQIGVATATPAYAIKSDYSFRIFPSTIFEGAFNARKIFNDMNIRKAAVMYTNNDYGVSEKESFVKEFEELGGKVVASESIDLKLSDYRAQVTKIMNSGPELVFLPVYPIEGYLALKQLNEAGNKAVLYATSAIEGNDFFKSKEFSEGLIIAVHKFDETSSDPKVVEFVETYKKDFNVVPEVYRARVYDALQIITVAIEQCGGKSGVCLKNQLESVPSWQGVLGEITFDENGDLSNPQFELLRVHDGVIGK